MISSPRRVLDAAALLSCLVRFVHCTPPDQRPLVPQKTEKLTSNDESLIETPSVNASVANILLFPGSRTYPDDLQSLGKSMPGCADNLEYGQVQMINLPINTCLSGEYYLRDNMRVLNSPTCPNGKTPTLSFYENRGCSGSRRTEIDTESTIQRCLWSNKDLPVSPYYWSLIYHCDEDMETVEHQTATPTLLHGMSDVTIPAMVRHHRSTSDSFKCHSEFSSRRDFFTVEPQTLWWESYLGSAWDSWGGRLETIEIHAPAICKNGQRAQLVLYQDPQVRKSGPKCADSETHFKKRLLDVDDWMLDTCFSMSNLPLTDGSFGRALALMFSCDGLESAEQVCLKYNAQNQKVSSGTRGPRMSHSECAIPDGRWGWVQPRPNTFMYPPSEKCISLPKDLHYRLREAPLCPDGTPARFAKWQNPGCQGWPNQIRGVNSIMLANCEGDSWSPESSYMFWCSPEGVTKEEREQGEVDSRAIISKDDCEPLDLKPGWVAVGRDAGPTIDRVEADTNCFSLSKTQPVKIFANAICKDGSPAKLSIHKYSRCYGESKVLDVGNDMLDACLSLCEGRSCSARFVC